MKLLIAGYTPEETNRLSAALRGAGHQVLGAVGRHGARTFVKVVTPDAVLVPAGAHAAEVRGWIADLAPGLAWVALAPDADPVRALETGLVAGLANGDAPVILEPAPAARADRLAPPDARTIDVAPSDWEPAPRPAAPSDRGGRDIGRAPGGVAFEPAPGGRGTGWSADELPPLPPPGLPGPARPDPSDRATESPPQDADLASKLAQTRFGDYHSLLELEPDASPYAVREQYTRLSRLYSPRGWPRKLGPEDIETLQEVASGIRDAYLILGEPELRARYERALLGTTSPSSRRR